MTSPNENAAGGAPLRPPPGFVDRLYAFLVSPKLAITLLIGILLCCLIGVTVFRGARAWEVIFSTVWFNALLVLLAISSGVAFFSRIWRRKLTLVSAGMILFHLSFVGVLGGVAINSLFHFKGVMRLTEGETLPNGEFASYDSIEVGRFFDFGRLRGTTTLVEMHRGYKVDGQDKRAAYEIAVGQEESQARGLVYITQELEHDGVRYLASKEGYSVLVVLSDTKGQEIYGGHVPLQSLRQPDRSYLYATGSAHGAEAMPFPPEPDEPRLEMLVTYRPNAVEDRAGDVGFEVVPYVKGKPEGERRSGRVPVGGAFDAGGAILSPREIRYWVAMDVRQDPGLNLVLASLTLALVGMVLIFVGRIRQGAARRRATAANDTGAALQPRTEVP